MCVRAGSGDSVCVRVCVCVCVCVRACVRAHAKCLCDFVTVEFVVTESSTGPIKRFREMIVAHVGGHGWGFPGLAPIRNSCELRVLCCRSYFGPRTCVRGITIFIEVCGALNQGFPFSPLQCRQDRARMGGGVQVYAACWGGVVYCFCNYVTRHG